VNTFALSGLLEIAADLQRDLVSPQSPELILPDLVGPSVQTWSLQQQEVPKKKGENKGAKTKKGAMERRNGKREAREKSNYG
jgi:hypothetical protein